MWVNLWDWRNCSWRITVFRSRAFRTVSLLSCRISSSCHCKTTRWLRIRPPTCVGWSSTCHGWSRSMARCQPYKKSNRSHRGRIPSQIMSRCFRWYQHNGRTRKIESARFSLAMATSDSTWRKLVSPGGMRRYRTKTFCSSMEIAMMSCLPTRRSRRLLKR